jgi:MOSC domain-containing protein YiiM
MQLISVNVGLPRDVTWQGRPVTTGIFKEPVAGRVQLRRLNLDGDRQADLRVHGGEHKAVYAYPHEHYAWWQRELGCDALSYGQFGENFTLSGLLEDEVCIGDVFGIGTAQVQVSQPRSPCFKLDLRMGEDGFLARFRAAQRVGFYLRVLEEGEVGAGDSITCLARDPDAMSVREIYQLRYGGLRDRDRLERAARLAALTPNWREAFEKQLSG